MEKVEIPTMKPTSSVWIPHPRPLRRSVGDGGGCVEGGRFSDLGQLFACARDIAIGKRRERNAGRQLGKRTGCELGTRIIEIGFQAPPIGRQHQRYRRAVY